MAPMTMTSVHDPRGSAWHRWDPHIHAPGTRLNDQFGGDWNGYFQRIEAATPAVRALGVTDYFSIDTYKELRRRRETEKRLQGIQLVFPNVELRLDTKTTKHKPINLHLLFSPDDPDHEKEIERILAKLKFPVGETEYQCTRSEFIRLGRSIDSHTNDDAACSLGTEQFKTTLTDVRNLFKTEKWMRNNCLVAVASKSGDGTSGLADDGSYVATRRDIESFSDIIFGANPNQRRFWLGQMDGHDSDYIEATYRGLKPCLHGSDAHRVSAVCEADEQRFCWLKGDVTFETLRQAVIEPEERVRIDEVPPSHGSPAEAIVNVEVQGASWLPKPSVPINQGLIAIIGARGSGKTALADILAVGAGASPLEAGNASFLHRASKHLGNATTELTWGDGSVSSRTSLSETFTFADEPSRVRYLSQHFVETLCSAPSLATELRREMERVVFESIEPSMRLGTSDFDQLADVHLEPITTRRSELADVIRQTADAILQEDERKEKLPAQRLQLQNLLRQIEVDKKTLESLLPKEKAAHAQKLTVLEGLVTTATARIEQLRLRRKTVDDLSDETHSIKTIKEPARHSEMKRRFGTIGYAEDRWAAFAMQFAGDVTATLSYAKTTLDSQIKQATEGPTDWKEPDGAPSADWPLERLKALRDRAKAEVGIDQDRQKKYEERNAAWSARTLAAIRLDQEIKHNSSAGQRYKDLITSRRQAYREIVATIVDEEALLRSLYDPVHKLVAGGKGALGKLAFSVRRHVDYERWCKTGEALIDLRTSGRFKGKGKLKEEVAKKLLSIWQTGDADAIATAMDDLRAAVWSDLINAELPSVAPSERREWQQQLATWFYDISHISVHYNIEYEKVSIEHLSPGTRGIVLLLLYLAIDQKETVPLIIDQPEENLDPKSVYTELVPHFREARKRRQVIVVTHNANLVVNTDADQVIVARSNRVPTMTLPSISYETGALENKAIRAAVCDILEGGERAFLERERRYRLKWGESLALEPPPEEPAAGQRTP